MVIDAASCVVIKRESAKAAQSRTALLSKIHISTL